VDVVHLSLCMDFFTLTVLPRKIGKQFLGKLRREKKVPGVIYGHGWPTQAIAVEQKHLTQLLQHVRVSPMVYLTELGEAPIPVLLKEVQIHPISEQMLHADFHRVRMEERMKTKVPLELTGESPAAKMFGGVLVRPVAELDIECLPADLVSSIRVDLGALQAIDDHIRIQDLVVPKGIRILHDADMIVVTVKLQREEEIEPSKPLEDVSQIADSGKKEKKEQEGGDAEGRMQKAEKGSGKEEVTTTAGSRQGGRKSTKE